MITIKNLKLVLEDLGFSDINGIMKKTYYDDISIIVDFNNKVINYPVALKVNEKQTCNFSQNENFVVLECINRLLDKGYKVENIELEMRWKLGHGGSGGRADILVRDHQKNPFLMIECKTYGDEYNNEWNNMINGEGQLFSYGHQETTTEFLCLYTSNIIDGKVVYEYKLIKIKDYIVSDDKDLLLYKNAPNAETRYKVWKETYKFDYFETGLFEDDVRIYELGKVKFNIRNLREINSSDIGKKYNQFASILRKFNVSGHENAFDKLVNLFLCKIVDETKNPNSLEFYWGGNIYDNVFDLQDRLQNLYQQGMKKFLGEEVTYINNKEIDNAFRYFENDINKTKNTIKDFIKQLKFFTNNDFAFIEVHNEKLFYENSQILIEMVKMIQDIKLKTNNEHQFLGDLFEGFLDQGIKQSEGQFFTPLPIVKYIISSLPIENIYKENDDVKAIDYACGAGHFLNEYSSFIKRNINNDKEYLSKVNSNIYGIEKEYRLSKVAKVSAFMYGQDEINIQFADALGSKAKIIDNDFDVLIANPPYSVKGFLETLNENELKKYSLTDVISKKQYATNNAIEAFFIEKAKQLLKAKGVAAIIVPSSLITKTGIIYEKTREIILKYFDIIAISEFVNGTFGKTGTNTIVLFLRRKNINPDEYAHYEDRAKSIFKLNKKYDEIFNDNELDNYILHQKYDKTVYLDLLSGVLNEDLFNHYIFSDYKEEFEKNSKLKALRKTKRFKDLCDDEKNKEIEELFINYILEKEYEKFYYYMLASKQKNPVVVVKMPDTKKEKKEFLGYEWSNAKGNEGIKYLADVKLDKDFDEETKKALKNLIGIDYINTPLYNPKIVDDDKKINYIIKNNYLDKDVEINEDLDNLVKKYSLIELLDFNKVNFDKTINIGSDGDFILETNWQLKKLKDVCDIKIGGTPSRKNPIYFNGDNLWVSVSELKSNIITDTKEKITKVGIENSNVKLIPKDTVLMSFKLSLGKVAISGRELYTNEAIAALIPFDESNLNYKYMFYLIKGKFVNLEKGNNAMGKSLNSKDVANIVIPLPTVEVQKQIVKECELLDEEFNSIRMNQDEYDLKFRKIFEKFDIKVLEEE